MTIQKSEILTSLYNANSCEEKFSILEEVILDAGFDAVLYSFYPKLSQLAKSLRPVFQFSNGYASLVEHYQKHDFSRHDFLIRLLENGETNVMDWWPLAEKIELSDEEKHVNHIARHKFGITKGIVFPTLYNDMGVAAVSIISFKAEDEHRQIEAKVINELHSCVRIYHDHMMVNQDDQIQFILPILELLTPKKKLVIKHLISGQPMKNIEGVTERYAEKLLLELRKGFGGISKNEMIYYLGLINITEYL